MNPAAWSWIAIPIAATALVLLSNPRREEPPMDDRDPVTDPVHIRASAGPDGQPYVEPDLGPPVDRPEPLQAVARSVAKVLGISSGAVFAVLGYLVLLLVTKDPVQALLGLLGGPAAAVSVATGAVRTANSARPFVTPTEDPREWVRNEAGQKVLEQLLPTGRHSKEA